MNPTTQKLQLMWGFHFSQTKGKKKTTPKLSHIFLCFLSNQTRPFLFTKIPRISLYNPVFLYKKKMARFFFPVFINSCYFFLSHQTLKGENNIQKLKHYVFLKRKKHTKHAKVWCWSEFSRQQNRIYISLAAKQTTNTRYYQISRNKNETRRKKKTQYSKFLYGYRARHKLACIFSVTKPKKKEQLLL